MATKAGDIMTRLQALGYATDTEAAQLLALNMVHKRVIALRRWQFLLSTDSSHTTTPGVGTYSLGTLAETRRVDAVRLESADGEKVLLESGEPSLVRDWEHMYPEVGTPEAWAILGQTLHIWPLPSKAYTIVIDVVARPTEITSKETEVQIPDSHADILAWAVIMSMTFRERDWDGHNFARQMYSELYAELLAQYGTTDRQTSKKVVQSGFYDVFDPESAWLI